MGKGAYFTTQSVGYVDIFDMLLESDCGNVKLFIRPCNVTRAVDVGTVRSVSVEWMFM